MINCVIFDCDGTMFDTEVLAKKAYVDFAQAHEIELDQTFWAGICGTGMKEAQPQINRFAPIRDNIELISKNRLVNITQGASIKDALVKKGLYPLLDYCKANNIKIAIASSSHLEYVHMLLNHMSKSYEFDYIICGDMITNKKPDPEIFNKAIELLQVDPANALILEDSKMGLIAGKAAGAINGFIEDCVYKDDEIIELMDYEFNDFHDVIELLENQK